MICRKCGTDKPADQFWKNQMRCIPCAKSYYRREASMARRYGVSEERLAQMFADRQGCCSICGREQSHTLQVDHDHGCCPGRESCGRCVRDLLCRPCNVKLNALEDTVWREAAEQYLHQHRKQPRSPFDGKTNNTGPYRKKAI